jgi:hypothetical protein
MKTYRFFFCQNCGGEMVFKNYEQNYERVTVWAHSYNSMDAGCYEGMFEWDGEDGRLPVEVVIKVRTTKVTVECDFSRKPNTLRLYHSRTKREIAVTRKGEENTLVKWSTVINKERKVSKSKKHDS